MTANRDHPFEQPDPDAGPPDPLRDRLPEYATSAALGGVPELQYPDVAAHLAECAACSGDLAELMALTSAAYGGNLAPTAAYPTPDLSFLAPVAAPGSGPDPFWWIDSLGRMVIAFSEALIDALRSPSPAGATRGQFLFRYTQEPGPLRVTIEAYAEDTIRQIGRVQVNVDLQNRDPLEQQGSHVTLRLDAATWEGETDEMGWVDFAPIPLTMLPRMRVEIAPPA